MKRGKLITVFCILGYLSVLFGFPQVFSPAIKRINMFLPLLYGMLVAMMFMAYVGIWYMKQWGASLFVAVFFSRTAFFILTGQMGVTFYAGIVFHLIFLIILLRAYPKMSPNL